MLAAGAASVYAADMASLLDKEHFSSWLVMCERRPYQAMCRNECHTQLRAAWMIYEAQWNDGRGPALYTKLIMRQ